MKRIIIVFIWAVFGVFLIARAQEHETFVEDMQLFDAASLEPFAVAVLPTTVLTNDPAHSELADVLISELHLHLAAVDGIHVLAPELVRPYADSSLSPVEIGRELGAATVVESSVASATRGHSVKIRSFDAVTGKLAFLTGSSKYDGWNYPADIERVQQWVAKTIRSIEYQIHPDRRPDRAVQLAIAKTTFMDTTREVEERIEAFKKLRPPTTGSYPPRYIDGGVALSGEVAIAAAQLAIQSEDRQITAWIWRTMEGVEDPNLVQPLIYSLANDTDEWVRALAASALAVHVDQPGVREALDVAQNDDVDSAVRQAAYLAMLPIEGLQYEFSKAVMDISLPDSERQTALFRLSQSNADYPYPLDAELVDTIAQFARTSSDAQTRQTAWFCLTQLGGREVVSLLIEALTEEPNEAVRESIISSLSGFLGEPDVFAAVNEAQLTDTSLLVRNAAERVLRGDEK